VGGARTRLGPAARLRSSFAVVRATLANPALRRLQLGAAASSAGDQLAVVALGVYAYAEGGAAAVGLVAVVQMVPAALLGPPTALLSDRYRRERVLLVAATAATLALTAAAVAAALEAPAAAVYALAAVLAVVTGAAYPAQTALIPLLARSTAEVSAATATTGLLRGVSLLAAPAFSCSRHPARPCSPLLPSPTRARPCSPVASRARTSCAPRRRWATHGGRSATAPVRPSPTGARPS